MLMASGRRGRVEARPARASGGQARDRVEVSHQRRKLATLPVLQRRKGKLRAPSAEYDRERTRPVIGGVRRVGHGRYLELVSQGL